MARVGPQRHRKKNRRDIQLLQIQAHCCKITERHLIPTKEKLGLFGNNLCQGCAAFSNRRPPRRE